MISKNDCLNIKNEINENKADINLLIEKKIHFFYNVIQKTIIYVQKNKNIDILGISDVNVCIEKLNEINTKIKNISDNLKPTVKQDALINELQVINNDFSALLKNYGTEKLEDLLIICFGINNKITSNETEELKLELLKKYFHPNSYKVINKKEETKTKKISIDKTDDIMINIECSDISTTVKQFHLKVYGIKVFINSSILKKSLVVYGIVDDIIIDYLNDKYIRKKQNEINENYEKTFNRIAYQNYINSLTLKDFLIYNSSDDFYKKFMGITSQLNSIKQKQTSVVVKEFIGDNMYSKRNILLNLLINSDNYENQYLSYLLYDLLSNESNGNIDTQEQTILYDSFPWSIKEKFKNAMKKTIQYTN